MWGYNSMLVCGMTMVGLTVSGIIKMIKLGTAVTSQNDKSKSNKHTETGRLFPWPI